MNLLKLRNSLGKQRICSKQNPLEREAPPHYLRQSDASALDSPDESQARGQTFVNRFMLSYQVLIRIFFLQSYSLYSTNFYLLLVTYYCPINHITLFSVSKTM